MNRSLAAVFLLLALPPAAASGEENPGRTEYWRRLAATPPRSAAAFVELAGWCRSAGLEAEAVHCYRQAIAIDLDCEPARTALGYKRYGTGWRKAGEAPEALTRDLGRAGRPAAPAASPAAVPVVPETVPAPPPATAAATVAAAGAPGDAAIPPAAAEPEATPTDAGSPAATATTTEPPAAGTRGTAAEAVDFTAAVEKKKAWAKAAAEKLATTFQVHEDNDFLIHTTLPTSSREMKTLVGYLKALKKIAAAIVGAGSSTRIWPDKLHLVLLKSEPEYERFADIVDGVKSARNPDGAYTQEDHTALWMPESPALPRLVGSTALRRLNGSDRPVGWWLEEGIAEAVFSQSPPGQKENHYAETLIHAAELIEADGENLKIFNVIETRDFRRRDEARSRALALSLVDFLMRLSKKGFQDLVKALKSERAPAPAASDAESSAHLLAYISFQEETMKTSFRQELPALNDKWKAFVLAAAAKLKAAREESEEPQQKRKGRQKKKGA